MTAKVTSLTALHDLRSAMARYEHDAREGLTMLVLEVRRAMEWLEHDRRRYWPAQARRASDRLVEARNALERCQLKYGSEDAPSCFEQKKAYEKARRRLRFCEEKVKATRYWIRVLREEVNTFEVQIAKMDTFLDGDLQRGVAALDRMLQSLEKYAGGTADVPTGAGNAPARPLESSGNEEGEKKS